jgi:exopolyphosphatase/guanosine-5'-triphosphate,3'-diphosphate pyrophosphatase
MSAGSVAAVDCGTNSTRLLVVDHMGASLVRLMRITRLGQGVDAAHELDGKAIDRTIEVLSEFRRVMDDYGVTRARMVATSAVRDAKNGADFLDAATEAIGVRAELLSGEEEGRLAYQGATAGLDLGAGPYLVVDLGGGSTELVTGGAAGGPVTAVSLDVGCVRLTERFLHGDPPDADEVTSATRLVDQLVDGALESHPDLREARQMVGVAGTVSTLATLALGLDRHDRELVHHSILTRSTVDALTAQLLAESREQRGRRRGIEVGRLDVIAGGALVLREVLARTGHEAVVVSESDILDAIAAELLA